MFLAKKSECVLIEISVTSMGGCSEMKWSICEVHLLLLQILTEGKKSLVITIGYFNFQQNKPENTVAKILIVYISQEIIF